MKKLFDTIFSAFNMQRWNDHIKNVDLNEMDKQSHKMIIAYIISKLEEEDGKAIDKIALIEGSIFETLHRLVVTDIKPPVFHKISGEKRKELDKWVIGKLEPILKEAGIDFYDKFCTYFNDSEYMKKEKHILAAAHFIATEYEFKLIYPANSFTYAIEETKEKIEKKIEQFLDIDGVKKIRLYKNLNDFIKICGQLRFQMRWAQVPRVPRTNVLGHMYFVAMISYFFSKKINACDKKLYNNFYTSLFHDLPEVLTRDIVTPVKNAVEDLDSTIKEIEKEEMKELIYPLLPKSIMEEIKYFTEDEFENRVVINGKIEKGINKKEMDEKYNSQLYNPVDGKMLKVFDHLAAFMEAYSSVYSYGIKGKELEEAVERLKNQYKDTEIAGIKMNEYFC